MKYFALAFVLIYLLFSYWQLNDPDPVWWTTLYLIPAYLSFRAFQQKFNKEMLITVSLLYVAYAIQSLLQVSVYEGYFSQGGGLEMKTPNQELVREASGLGICVFTFVIYLVYSYRKVEVQNNAVDFLDERMQTEDPVKLN